MVSVPVRDGPVFAAARKVIDPSPSPPPGGTIVIHGAPLLDVHPHPSSADTLTALSPPPAFMLWRVGLMTNAHGFGSCDTRTLLSLNVMSASRTDGRGFGST